MPRPRLVASNDDETVEANRAETKNVCVQAALCYLRTAGGLLAHAGLIDESELADLLIADIVNAAVERGIRPESAEISEARARFRDDLSCIANQMTEAKL